MMKLMVTLLVAAMAISAIASPIVGEHNKKEMIHKAQMLMNEAEHAIGHHKMTRENEHAFHGLENEIRMLRLLINRINMAHDQHELASLQMKLNEHEHAIHNYMHELDRHHAMVGDDKNDDEKERKEILQHAEHTIHQALEYIKAHHNEQDERMKEIQTMTIAMQLLIGQLEQTHNEHKIKKILEAIKTRDEKVQELMKEKHVAVESDEEKRRIIEHAEKLIHEARDYIEKHGHEHPGQMGHIMQEMARLEIMVEELRHIHNEERVKHIEEEIMHLEKQLRENMHHGHDDDHHHHMTTEHHHHHMTTPHHHHHMTTENNHHHHHMTTEHHHHHDHMTTHHHHHEHMTTHHHNHHHHPTDAPAVQNDGHNHHHHDDGHNHHHHDDGHNHHHHHHHCSTTMGPTSSPAPTTGAPTTQA